MSPAINIKELEILMFRIFEKLKKDCITDFSFDWDEYWIITTDEWANFNIEPTPVVGSLNDDIRYLHSVYSEDLVISYLEFEKLASVFRAIGEKMTCEPNR